MCEGCGAQVTRIGMGAVGLVFAATLLAAAVMLTQMTLSLGYIGAFPIFAQSGLVTVSAADLVLSAALIAIECFPFQGEWQLSTARYLGWIGLTVVRFATFWAHLGVSLSLFFFSASSRNCSCTPTECPPFCSPAIAFAILFSITCAIYFAIFIVTAFVAARAKPSTDYTESINGGGGGSGRGPSISVNVSESNSLLDDDQIGKRGPARI